SLMFARIRGEVAAAVGDRPQRDVLIFADGTGFDNDGNPLVFGGQGTLVRDEEPGITNVTNAGGMTAILYIPGTGADLWGGDGSLTYPVQAGLHEMSHNLGAVQLGTPHSTGAGHCWDSYDVMCYDDGGAKIPAGTYADGASHPCPRGAGPDAYDCGGDDYFNPSPAAGSYLASHWNVYNSVF